MNATDPIGFFDSGLGGISILRTTLALMPGEDFLYYGDSCHAPDVKVIRRAHFFNKTRQDPEVLGTVVKRHKQSGSCP